MKTHAISTRRAAAVTLALVAALPLLAAWIVISERFSGDDLNFAWGAVAVACFAGGIAVGIVVYRGIVR